MVTTGEKVVKTICKMCPAACGIEISVRDGKIAGVAGMKDHPFKELCPKVEGLEEWIYSPERVTVPLKRVAGGWEEVSWDEALNSIAQKLTEVKEKYGGRSLALHLGNPFIATPVEQVSRRFCDLYGTPNYTSGASFCFYVRNMAQGVTWGTLVFPSFFGSQCILLWGSNPRESGHMVFTAINAMKEKGAKLIVVDPRNTPLAKNADIYVQIRPGTDCALALGLLRVIIQEKLFDKDFVEKWTVGFDKLAEQVKPYTPQKVEEITWVPADKVVEIARTYATAKPASLSPGISVEHCTNGLQTLRALAVMIGITGNFDVPGGNSYAAAGGSCYAPRLERKILGDPEQISLDKSVGAAYPIFSQFVQESTATPIPEAILTGKPYSVKAMIVQGSNPVLTWPNTNKVKKALGKLELLVVIDPFMTDTARLAHFVLPPTLFAERKELKDYRHLALPLVLLADGAIEPPGKAQDDWKIWAELGKRMGYAEHFPWKDSEELYGRMLLAMGLSLAKIKENPKAGFYGRREYRKYLEEGFSTPSGKVEIYSERLKSLGYDPLPTFHEPAEGYATRPDLAQKYPLILITGIRNMIYTHSQYRNVPALRKYVPQPLLEIHPRTAKGLGIAQGDEVVVESFRGSVKFHAHLAEDIHPKVVAVPHGWSEANANILTDDVARDPVSGYPGFRSVLVRVSKSQGKATEEKAV